MQSGPRENLSEVVPEEVPFVSEERLLQLNYGVKVRECRAFRILVDGDRRMSICKIIPPPSAFKKDGEKYSEILERDLSDYEQSINDLSIVERITGEVDVILRIKREYMDYVRDVENVVMRYIEFSARDDFELREILRYAMERCDLSFDFDFRDLWEKRESESLRKSFERAIEKALSAHEYNGNFTYASDYARRSFVFEKREDVDKIIDFFLNDKGVRKFAKQIYIKNRMSDEDAEKHPVNYRDAKVLFRLNNGHVVELQLHVSEIAKVKKEGYVVPLDSFLSVFSPEEMPLVKEYAKKNQLLTFAEVDSESQRTMVLLCADKLYHISRALFDNPELRSKFWAVEGLLYKGAWERQLEREKKLDDF